VIFLYNKEEELKELAAQVEEYEQQKKSVEVNGIKCQLQFTPRIAYATALLQIFAVGTEGKNAITEVKCQSLLSLS